MSRAGQVWEIDLEDDSFSPLSHEKGSVITYLVLERDTLGEGWRCLVLVDTPFEEAGYIMHRPEFQESWEGRPQKWRQLA